MGHRGRKGLTTGGAPRWCTACGDVRRCGTTPWVEASSEVIRKEEGAWAALGGDSGSEEGRTTVVHGELHTGMKRPGGRQILELLTVASLRRSSAR
jgi:hypothetical protein